MKTLLLFIVSLTSISSFAQTLHILNCQNSKYSFGVNAKLGGTKAVTVGKLYDKTKEAVILEVKLQSMPVITVVGPMFPQAVYQGGGRSTQVKLSVLQQKNRDNGYKSILTITDLGRETKMAMTCRYTR